MYDVGLGGAGSGEEEGRNSLEMVQEKLEAYLRFKEQHLYLLMTFQFSTVLGSFRSLSRPIFHWPSSHTRQGGWDDPSPSKLIPGRPHDLNLRLLPGQCGPDSS